MEGRIGMTTNVVEHFDTCLGCMACETACPSGVRYAPLIEQTRAAVETGFRRSAGERWFRRLLFSTLPYPSRLRILAWPMALVAPFRRSRWFQRLLPARLRPLMALAPDVRAGALAADVPERTAPTGDRRARVGLVTGCVQRAFFGGVNQATTRVLAAEGCQVEAPRSQGCCGALALHAGRVDEARAFARRTIEVFERAGVERIAVNAAGCGSSMKEYGQLLADDPAWADRARAFSARVRDVTEIVSELGPSRAPRHPLPLRVAYHDACHLAHAQGVRQPPRDLLRSIPGVEILPFAEQEICCGSAGIYNLVEPDAARELGERKAGHIDAVSPDLIATANPGCMLQMATASARLGRVRPICHPIEILDASIRGVDLVEM
jgi:glycolate oxidase iron-sulfur subunit